MSYGEWSSYVPVAKRRAIAAREIRKLREEGKIVQPVEVQGRKIARTFWGEAWCGHLEKFSDYKNRLPRGRTYVRNGSVCHLAIASGRIEAIVSGSHLYRIRINIAPLPTSQWEHIRRECSGQIGSMLELLEGRFSDNVMKIVTNQDTGLFPRPTEMDLACDCPDWAGLCKHLAAVLYGVGTRLDDQPELLFTLRNVDHEELISAELDMRSATSGRGKRRRLAGADLADVFGVDMAEPASPGHKIPAANKRKTNPNKKKPFTATAAAVTRLRKRLGMNASQFASLLGVSPPTVSNWENGSGKLNLRRQSLESLNKVAALSPQQAMKKLACRRRDGAP